MVTSKDYAKRQEIEEKEEIKDYDITLPYPYFDDIKLQMHLLILHITYVSFHMGGGGGRLMGKMC